MKVGIMQPYFFPYIGYFQLLNYVDTFVIYDDVSFIKQGWINRNRIIVSKVAKFITVPLINQSSNKAINQTHIDYNKPWTRVMLKTVEQSYKKASYFHKVYPLVSEVLNANQNSISKLAVSSIKAIMGYLDLNTTLVTSSEVFQNSHLSSEARVMDICFQTGASHYVNPENGSDLYSKESFKKHNIKLSFLKPPRTSYRQFDNQFIPHLSIIDVLMFNSPKACKELLEEFVLL